MSIDQFTRRGPEVRFMPDNGAAVAGGSSATTVETPAASAAAGQTSLPSAEFLSYIPGGELLLPKAAAAEEEPVLEEEVVADPADPVDPAKKPEDEEEIPETEAQKPHVLKMQKRIGKLTAQREEAREALTDLTTERDTLKQQLEEARTATAAAPLRSENPLAAIRSADKLAEAITHAEGVRKWALQNRDGATIKDPNAPGGERDLSPEEMTAIFLHHDDILRKHGPAQQAFIRALEQQTAQATEKYPWLKDTKSPEYKLRGQVLAAWPEVMRFPDYETFIGQWIRGYQAEQADTAKSPAGDKPAAPPVLPVKPAAPIAPTPPKSGSPTPKTVQSSKSKETAALAALSSNPGNRDALASFFR